MASTTKKPKILSGPSWADLDRMPNKKLLSDMGVSGRSKDIAARMKVNEEREKEKNEQTNIVIQQKNNDEVEKINRMNARTREYEQKMGSVGGRRVKKRSCKKRSYKKKRSCKKRCKK